MPSARAQSDTTTTTLLGPAIGTAILAALAWGITIVLAVDGDAPDGTIAVTAAFAASTLTAGINLGALHWVRRTSGTAQSTIRAGVDEIADRIDDLELGVGYQQRYAEIDRKPAVVRHLR